MDLSNKKPKWPDLLISWLCKERYAEEILGDLEEYFYHLHDSKKSFKTLRYWYQSFHFLRPFALKIPFKNSTTGTMLKMNLKIAFRNLARHKFYSFINILGLALGITTCLFIGIFISDEMSYDTHWENADRIYRVAGHLKFEDNEWNMATSPAPMAAAFKEDFPEIKNAGRMRNTGSAIFELDKRMIKVDETAYVDQEIFDIFSFKIIDGRADLTNPNTSLISASTSKMLFGTTSGTGKTFKQGNTTYEVVGVYQDIPTNTHFHYDAMASMENWSNAQSKEWMSNNFRTYFLLEEGKSYKELEGKFTSVYEKYYGPSIQAHAGATWEQFLQSGSIVDYYLQPIEKIHLFSDLSYEIEQNGSYQYIVIFGAAGLFILIIACINFMNISTARSSVRAKEVGMRKVMGSKRGYLINQFMLESLMNAFIAGVIATILIYTLLPFFNHLTDKHISNPYFGRLFLFPWVLIGTVAVGLLAGTYPALYLSRFIPIKVLKGELRLGLKSGWMRNVLVIIQFSASVILIFGAIVIGSQLGYIRNKSLGFEKDQVLILQNTYMMGDKIESFKEELLNDPTIKNVTVTSYLPTADSRSDSPLLPWDATNMENFVSLQIWKVDEKYIPTLGMELSDGRNFKKDMASDSNAVILNKAAADKFGFQEPVDQRLKTVHSFDIGGMKEFHVIGVVENFHFDSFKSSISPMVLLNMRSTGNVALKFEAGKTTQVIEKVDQLWREFNPTLPFEYTFMDQQFEAKYRSEQKLGTLLNIFSSLAIFIACLGLFGLAAFTTDQRKKELGIRKVLGASLPHLMIRQMSGYTKLLLISVALSLPLGFYLMSQWLQNFVYRTEIGTMMFVLPVMMVLLLAWLTVSIISYRAATQNPAENLKYE